MASDYNAAIQQRADLVREARAVLDLADRERRGLSATERARLDGIETTLSGLNLSIAEMEMVREADRNRHAGPERGPARSARYADLFGAGALSADGWRSMNDFLAAVHSGQYNPQLITATMTGGIGADGGFLVPTEYAAAMLDAALEDEIVRPRAEVWPMTTDTRKVAGVDGSTASGGTLFGGITGQWVAEAGAISTEDVQLRRIQLEVKKLAALTQASNELIADGLNFDQMLGGALVKALGWHLDYAFLRGTGAGQPLGVLDSPVTVSVAKETGQAAATIVYENVVNMLARLHPACVGKSVWVANPTCIPQLLTLSLPIGTSGAHVPAMMESNGQYTMLTRPVVFTEKLPAVGTTGDIMLCDFSQYVIGLRKEVTLDKSTHFGFNTDTSYYRVIMRADGQPKWQSAYTPFAGSTLSPFVKLDTRA